MFIKTRNIDESILYSHNLFLKYINLIRRYDKNFTLKNKVILEIGPGDNFLLAYIFILNGAEKVYLIDKFHKPLDISYDLILLKRYIKKFFHFFTDYNLKNIENKIKYYANSPFENFNVLKKNSIDLIISNAVLEHIFDIESAIRIISLLLKDGGLTIHRIDLRDHLHIADNCFLDFLKFSPRFWRFFGDLTNRMRYPEYINLFDRYHLELIYIYTLKIGLISKINKIKNNFNRNYRFLNDEDLSIGAFDIIAKK